MQLCAADTMSNAAAAPAILALLKAQQVHDFNPWDTAYINLRGQICSTAVSLHTRAARGGDDGCVFTLQNILDTLHTTKNWPSALSEACEPLQGNLEISRDALSSLLHHAFNSTRLEQHFKELVKPSTQDTLPISSVMEVFASYILTVKLSGAYPAEDLVDRLKWVIAEIILQPLELLVWFVSQCEDEAKALETPWKCFVRACAELRVDPIGASRTLTNLGVSKDGITNLTRQQVAAAQRGLGQTKPTATIDCSFLARPGEARALLDSVQAFVLSGKAAARVAQSPEVASFISTGCQLQSEGQPHTFQNIVDALIESEVAAQRTSVRAERNRRSEVIRTVKTALEAAVAPFIGTLESAIGNTLEWQLTTPTAYTYAQRMHTVEFKGLILPDDPAGNALTVAAWGFVTAAKNAEDALDSSALAMKAIQKVLRDRQQLQSPLPVWDAEASRAAPLKSVAYMQQSALKHSSAKYGNGQAQVPTSKSFEDPCEDPLCAGVSRATTGSATVTTPQTSPDTPMPLVFTGAHSNQTPDAANLGACTPFAGQLLVPVPCSFAELPPAGGSSTKLPALRLPGNLILPMSQESNCTLEIDSDDECLDAGTTSLQLSAEEPETPGVDQSTQEAPIRLPGTPQGGAAQTSVSPHLALPGALPKLDWGHALPLQAAASRCLKLKLQLSSSAQDAQKQAHALAVLRREPTMMDQIATHLGYVPVISVGLDTCPSEVAV